MTDEECRQLFGKLTQILERVGLGWVAREVQETVGLGKVEEQKLLDANVPIA